MIAKLQRREFITLLGGAATWPLMARAQQSVSKVPRIGIIEPAAQWDHFRQGLRRLGYIEGRDITIEYRSAEGRPEQLVAAAWPVAARAQQGERVRRIGVLMNTTYKQRRQSRS